MLERVPAQDPQPQANAPVEQRRVAQDGEEDDDGDDNVVDLMEALKASLDKRSSKESA